MKQYEKDVEEILNNKGFKDDLIKLGTFNPDNRDDGGWKPSEKWIRKVLLAGFKDFYEKGNNFKEV